MTCVATRLILLAFAVGLVVSSVTGSDAVGWLAAGVAVALAFAAGRLVPNRSSGSACAVPMQHVPDEVEVMSDAADIKVESTPI